MTQIVLDQLTMHFGDVLAVDRVDLTVDSGEMLALLGPSGCGKTTTLRMITGLLAPSEGAVRFDGESVVDIPTENRGAVMVFQKHLLFPTMSVAQNVGFGLRMAGVDRADIDQRVEEMLGLVKLPGYGNRRPHELSGGQQQRIALARALIVRPKLLLLDEPLANLDANLRLEMRTLIRDIQRETGTTTIFVTHDQEEAVMLADRVALMLAGQIQQVGPSRDFYERPASRDVARFFRSENFWQVEKRGSGLHTPVGKLHLVGDAAQTQDGMVWVTVRPELIELEPSGPDNRLPAKIIDQIYLGTSTQVTLELSGGVRWQALGPASFCGDVGQTLEVRLPPKGIWVLSK